MPNGSGVQEDRPHARKKSTLGDRLRAARKRCVVAFLNSRLATSHCVHDNRNTSQLTLEIAKPSIRKPLLSGTSRRTSFSHSRLCLNISKMFSDRSIPASQSRRATIGPSSNSLILLESAFRLAGKRNSFAPLRLDVVVIQSINSPSDVSRRHSLIQCQSSIL